MERPSAEHACLTTAAAQLGAIARAQALAAEMTPRETTRRLESGRWKAPHRGVYVISGAPAAWEQRAMVAQLRGGPRAVLSQLTAARLLGLYHL